MARGRRLPFGAAADSVAHSRPGLADFSPRRRSRRRRRSGPVLPADALARLPHRYEYRSDDEKVQTQQVSTLEVGLRQAMDLDHSLLNHQGTGLDPIALPPRHPLRALHLFDGKEEVGVDGCPRIDPRTPGSARACPRAKLVNRPLTGRSREEKLMNSSMSQLQRLRFRIS